MPTHSRMPAYRRRAPAAGSTRLPWRRLLAALVHGFPLIAVVLCALAHGPVDDPHRSPTVTAPLAAASTAGPEAPHGPHGHHSAEECLPGGVLRAPAAQIPDQPPTADPTPLLAGTVAAAVGPLRPGRRRPHRRRRARTGRTALIRTSRWRI